MNAPSRARSGELDWDYSVLAASYEKRAPYAAEAIAEALDTACLPARARALDVGAGTGRLTAILAACGLAVTALEPNREMRAIGVEKTRGLDVAWRDARGENTGCADASFDLVAFGSSFNVFDPTLALREASRVLHGAGWLMCLWNHRDLTDPLQAKVEASIRRNVRDYRYGTRRDDPSGLIDASELFGPVLFVERCFMHRTHRADFIDGFRAHATLRRQSGALFPRVLADIEHELASEEWLDVPFSTRVWMAQRAE